MTYLELVKRLRSECGVAGDGPSTTVGQIREMQRLCNWIVQSWEEIQLETREFDFMRNNTTWDTVANQQTYIPTTDIGLTDFGSWKDDSFKAYLASAGVATEIALTQYKSYADFRAYYLTGSRRLVTGRPMYITITPDRSLMLGFTPNDVYTCSAEYFRSPQTLAADADIPIMPQQYHMAIVYRAMQKYGRFNAAGEQVEAGQAGYSSIINRLVADQSPQIMYGSSFI